MKAAAPIAPIAGVGQTGARKGASAPPSIAVAGGSRTGAGQGSWEGQLAAASAQPILPDDGIPADASLEWMLEADARVEGLAPRAPLGQPGAFTGAPATDKLDSVITDPASEPDHVADEAWFEADVELAWQVGAIPRASLGEAAAQAAALGPQAGLGRPVSSLGARSGAWGGDRAAPPLDLGRFGANPPVGTSGPQATPASLGRQPTLGPQATPPRAANVPSALDVRPTNAVDLLGPAPRTVATFDGAPWLGLESNPNAVPAADDGGRLPAPASSLRQTLAAATPARFALLSDQVAAEASARVAALTRDDVDIERTRTPTASAPRALPLPRAAAAPSAGVEQAAPQEASLEAPLGEAGSARKPALATSAQAASRAPTPQPVATSTLPLASDVVAPTPGGNPTLSASTTVTRVHTLQAATVVDARFTDGQVPQQIGTPDLTRIELEVEEGDHALKVTLAREADGLAVEVRGPREVVAELRALRPEIDAALAEEGFDLTAYDADEDPDAGAGDGDEDDTLESDNSPNATASATAAGAPTGRVGLLDRQA